MSDLSFQEQEAIEDFIQYTGSITYWDSEQGFRTLLAHLEQFNVGVRIEDHSPQWKVYLKDPEGAFLSIGTSYDERPWRALALAVVQARINDPVGFAPGYRHVGYVG
jgi:hypothetical protein